MGQVVQIVHVIVMNFCVCDPMVIEVCIQCVFGIVLTDGNVRNKSVTRFIRCFVSFLFICFFDEPRPIKHNRSCNNITCTLFL